jgi:CCR4-NOT transcriptional regulation complex NOT5 subunit
MTLHFQMQLPKCYAKAFAELKLQNMVKFPDKTLIYVFYNIENRTIQYEAVKLLYQREWMYHFEEYIWFFKPNFNAGDASNSFFHIKKWDFAPYQFPIRKEQFAKLDDFESLGKIKEGSNLNNSQF